MKKDLIMTLVVGLIYVVILSLPRWNYEALFDTQMGGFILLQPIVHILLLIGLLKRKLWCRNTMLVLLGISILLSLSFVAQYTNLFYVSYVVVSLVTFYLLLKSKLISGYLNTT